MIFPHEIAFSCVISALLRSGAKRATKYIDAKTIVKATHQSSRPPRKNDWSQTLVVTFGRPNYAERQFIKDCKKAGVPFPVRKVQLKLWPKKRKP